VVKKANFDKLKLRIKNCCESEWSQTQNDLIKIVLMC